MKTTFFILVIVIISYILLVFISPSVADNMGEKLGILDTNNEIRNFKSGLDLFSTNDKTGSLVESGITSTGRNPIEEITNIQGGIIQARDIITNKITETKTNIDDTRKAVDETNKNIQKTQSAINDTINSATEVQNSLGKIVK